MLSIAAQREFLRLLSDAKASRAHGRHFSRIGDGVAIAAKIALFRDAMKPLAALLPKEATSDLDHNLDTVEAVIAIARNAATISDPPTRAGLLLGPIKTKSLYITG